MSRVEPVHEHVTDTESRAEPLDVSEPDFPPEAAQKPEPIIQPKSQVVSEPELAAQDEYYRTTLEGDESQHYDIAEEPTEKAQPARSYSTPDEAEVTPPIHARTEKKHEHEAENKRPAHTDKTVKAHDELKFDDKEQKKTEILLPFSPDSYVPEEKNKPHIIELDVGEPVAVSSDWFELEPERPTNEETGQDLVDNEPQEESVLPDEFEKWKILKAEVKTPKSITEPPVVELVGQFQEKVEQLEEEMKVVAQQHFEEIVILTRDIRETQFSEQSVDEKNDELVEKTRELFEILEIVYEEKDIKDFIKLVTIHKDVLETSDQRPYSDEISNEQGTKEFKNNLYLISFVQFLQKLAVHLELGRLTLSRAVHYW